MNGGLPIAESRASTEATAAPDSEDAISSSPSITMRSPSAANDDGSAVRMNLPARTQTNPGCKPSASASSVLPRPGSPRITRGCSMAGTSSWRMRSGSALSVLAGQNSVDLQRLRSRLATDVRRLRRTVRCVSEEAMCRESLTTSTGDAARSSWRRFHAQSCREPLDKHHCGASSSVGGWIAVCQKSRNSGFPRQGGHGGVTTPSSNFQYPSVFALGDARASSAALSKSAPLSDPASSSRFR